MGSTAQQLHYQKTQVLFGAGEEKKLEQWIKTLAPPLSCIVLLSDTTTRDKTNRFFEKKLFRLGYRVFTHTVTNSSSYSTAVCNDIFIPEETKVIVGCGDGGIAALTKYFAESRKLTAAFIALGPTMLSALTPSAVLLHNGVEEIFAVKPFRSILCDPDFFTTAHKDALPVAFGELVSKCVALFDYQFAHFLAKEPFDFEIMHKGYAIIDSALEFFSAPFSPSFLEKIAELSIKFSELTQKMGNSRLLCGGESQTAHAMNLLFLHEERALRLRGEVEMFVAPIVMNLYQSTLLQKRSFFVSPPDNNARLHYLCEFFGLKQQRIINKIRPILSNNEVDLMTYRLDEYREELSELAMKNSSRLQRGWKIFKRLYTDDGYALRKEIDSSDVSIALALAPDLKNKFTFLTALKCMGLLEGYIGE